ncbi:MAG: hypothetical protein WAZ63_14105, partial [Rhodoferax sp.]|uniref:hypothetical protein n=1 Tax=Rhodoferax sp. TaxID=50421 RepID=UPI003BB684E2
DQKPVTCLAVIANDVKQSMVPHCMDRHVAALLVMTRLFNNNQCTEPAHESVFINFYRGKP